MSRSLTRVINLDLVTIDDLHFEVDTIRIIAQFLVPNEIGTFLWWVYIIKSGVSSLTLKIKGKLKLPRRLEGTVEKHPSH